MENPMKNTHFSFLGRGNPRPKIDSEDRNSNFDRAVRNWSPNRLKIGPFWDPKVVQKASYLGKKIDAKKYTFKKK